MLHLNKYILIAVLLVGAISTSAHATLMMGIESGTDSFAYTDEGAGDQAPGQGALTAIGPVGIFGVNVITGISKPLIGNLWEGRLDLNSINVSFGAGEIVIKLTDTDYEYGDGLAHVLTEIGGTFDGKVNIKTYVDDQNQPWVGTLVADISNSLPGAFSHTESSFVQLTGKYSITHVVTLTHFKTGDISSFDLITTVPEPDVLALFGIGILLLGAATRQAGKPESSLMFRC